MATALTASQIYALNNRFNAGNAKRLGLGDLINDALLADDASVTVAKLDPAVMVEATGTLSQANLQAIGTPVSLVAAPGAGKVIIVDELELFHDYSTTVYATGADLQFEYQTTGTNWALVDVGFVTASADKNVVIKPSCYDLDASTGTAEGFDMTSHANKALQVTGSNFTNGNVANIVKYRIRYHVVTLLA